MLLQGRRTRSLGLQVERSPHRNRVRHLNPGSTSTSTSDRGRDFADLVYQVLIAEKRYSAERVAEAIGLGYDALYSRIRNRVIFSADELRALVAVAPDPRFVAYLLRGTAFVAAERAAPEADAEGEAIHRGATRIILEAADVLEAVEIALRDGRIDHKDALDIRREIEIAERALASLRVRIGKTLPSSALPA